MTPVHQDKRVPMLLLLLLPVLGTSSPPYHDEYPGCGDRAGAGECHGGALQSTGVALQALTDCRKSCRVKYQNQALPSLIKELGGLGDTVVDVFGISVALCDPAEGLDRVARRTLLAHSLVGRRVTEWIPAVTEVGYRVERIPTEMVRMLEMARLRGQARRQEEVCGPHYSPKNCQELVEGESECSVRNSRKVEVIPLDHTTKRIFKLLD